MNIEKDLLVRLTNADEDAFREIFDCYFKKLHRSVYRYIKEKTHAEDLTQNIFIKLWEKKVGIDINKSFDGYIFAVSYRIITDHFRQTEKRLLSATSDAIINESIVSSSSSDELLNRHQLECLYEKGLQTLPQKRKEIFLLSRHNGLFNKQIAERLNISVKTVKNQMLSFPKGSKPFRLVLADGTFIMLNAASSITYPTAFIGEARKVRITGEAYFEVVKKDNLPFHVSHADMVVKVSGTHFNLHTYEDEEDVKVTLLEGAVDVVSAGKNKLLRPGQQQASISGHGIKVLDAVDTDEVMAWKNDQFYFAGTKYKMHHEAN
ncbi:MAG: sigma-70 family RNA polymerase sigma factor [Chitinophagaceae bacterium]